VTRDTLRPPSRCRSRTRRIPIGRTFSPRTPPPTEREATPGLALTAHGQLLRRKGSLMGLGAALNVHAPQGRYRMRRLRGYGDSKNANATGRFVRHPCVLRCVASRRCHARRADGDGPLRLAIARVCAMYTAASWRNVAREGCEKGDISVIARAASSNELLLLSCSQLRPLQDRMQSTHSPAGRMVVLVTHSHGPR
jgi:hypothetical protein